MRGPDLDIEVANFFGEILKEKLENAEETIKDGI
jgi:hypothetical protein